MERWENIVNKLVADGWLERKNVTAKFVEDGLKTYWLLTIKLEMVGCTIRVNRTDRKEKIQSRIYAIAKRNRELLHEKNQGKLKF
jgi:hypothetical protein